MEQAIFLNRVRPSGRLDISVGYDITKQITVSLDAINVTKSTYKGYWDDVRNPRGIRSYDDLYAIGLHFQFSRLPPAAPHPTQRKLNEQTISVRRGWVVM